MNVLVTLNANYIHPLKVMLTSLFVNNPDETFQIYLMHSSLTEEEINDIRTKVEENGSKLHNITVGEDCFSNAPTLMHYTKEMYYRLLAFKVLPKEIDRILYIDPDILVLNPVRKLYETDLSGYYFAAANHNIISYTEINKIRLGVYDIEAYYNSGVLLMNLEEQRKHIDENEIYNFLVKNKTKLILPDQDIMNALFSKKIKSLDEKLYNYDARRYRYYKIATNGECDMHFVIYNTVMLHFCGKRKPWKDTYSGRFHALYKHYEKLAIS